MLSKIEMELCEQQAEAHPDKVRELDEAARVHGLLSADVTRLRNKYESAVCRLDSAAKRHNDAARALLDAMGAES